MEEMAEKIENRAARRKAEKKSKKESKKQSATSTATSLPATSTCIKEEQLDTAVATTTAIDLQPIVSMKLIKTELINPDTLKKEEKAGPSGSKILSKSTKRSGNKEALLDPALKKLKDGSDYSVANDPKATAVYKSIFTTHESARQQDRAHWVTYNPFYN